MVLLLFSKQLSSVLCNWQSGKYFLRGKMQKCCGGGEEFSCSHRGLCGFCVLQRTLSGNRWCRSHVIYNAVTRVMWPEGDDGYCATVYERWISSRVRVVGVYSLCVQWNTHKLALPVRKRDSIGGESGHVGRYICSIECCKCILIVYCIYRIVCFLVG